MRNKATDLTPGMRLTMVSVPQFPGHDTQVLKRTRMLGRFNLGQIAQYAALLLMVVTLSAASYVGVSHYFLETVQVVGVSMVPTLEENGHYLLNRWAFHQRDPKRSDVVVIRDPSDHGFSVKRVIATAGESVHFKDGKVFVNGKELEEPYLSPNTHTFTYSQAKEQLITCGKDQYFVLGDNRLRSIDSRSYGTVPRDNVLGLVMVQ